MKILKFETNIWKDENITDPIGNFVNIMPGENGLSWTELFHNRFRELEPGIDSDQILSISFNISFIDDNLDFIKLNHFMQDYFESVFSEGNVLSIRGTHNENVFVYYILCFPLVRRVLRASNWIIKNEEGKYVPHQDIINGFVRTVETTFSVIIDNENDYIKNNVNQGPLAKIDLISKMEIPKENPSIYKENIYDAAGYDAQIITDAGYKRFTEICAHIISYFTTGIEKSLYFKAQTGSITPEIFLEEVNKTTKRLYPNISDRDLKLVLKKVYSAVYQNYILDDLIEADDISDIKVIDPKHIRVKVNGKRMTSNVTFINADDYFNYINSLAIRYGLDLSNEAYHVFTDKTTSPKFILRM